MSNHQTGHGFGEDTNEDSSRINIIDTDEKIFQIKEISMDTFIKYFKYFNFYFRSESGNTDSKLNEAETELNIIFQKEFRNILKLYDGGYGDIGKYYIDLWGIDDILNFYDDIGDEDMQDMIVFASDGCGMSYAFVRNSDEIRLVPMDSLDYISSERCSDSFEKLIMEMASGELREFNS